MKHHKQKTEAQNSLLGEAMKRAYSSGQEDEALEPLIAVDSRKQPLGRIQEGDTVVFYDIRGEREVELTESLTVEGFSHFPVKNRLDLNFVTMIEYASFLPVKVAFPPDRRISNTLAEVVTRSGMRLLKISESEKAVHVGYFMNGKTEKIFPGEERKSVPSPEGVLSYALTPRMSASLVAKEVCRNLKDSPYSLIVANLANVDVVGHIEEEKAVVQAVEAVDRELGNIIQACQTHGVTLVVTSDHGTVEEWLYPDGHVNTGHTKNPVPFILADFHAEDPGKGKLREKGELSDVAPTILALLGLEKPGEMTGKNLTADLALKQKKKGKILLLILDGWGIREEKEGNLIAQARTPHFDALWSQFPHTTLQASGEAVGMPSHTVGNSEAGHLHLGAGRRILLDRVKIDKAIEEGSFFQNRALAWAMEKAREKGKALHLLGIVSHYSSHGTIRHLFALLQMAKQFGVKQVFVHALIGRRGEKPESGAIYVDKIEQKCRELSVGKIVTVMGRFWALDREKNWDRVEKAYRALVLGEGTPVLTL